MFSLSSSPCFSQHKKALRLEGRSHFFKHPEIERERKIDRDRERGGEKSPKERERERKSEIDR